MEYGTKVIIKERRDLPGTFRYAGAEAVVKPCFTEMKYYGGMENFLCLEITEANEKELVGNTIFLHSSRVERKN